MHALRFSKKVVIILLVSVAVFTVTMIVTYYTTGSVPDTLVTEFFGFFKIEGGILGVLKAVETFIDIVKARNIKPDGKIESDENKYAAGDNTSSGKNNNLRGS